jgi:uncharacterized protein (TIGR03546 family)
MSQRQGQSQDQSNEVNRLRPTRAIAAGCSFGLLLGLLPLDCLLTAIFLLSVVVLPVSKWTSLVIASCLWVTAGIWHPLTHFVGCAVLGNTWVASGIAQFYELPMAPWLQLENAWLAGGLVIGIVAWLPVYSLSFRVFARPNAEQRVSEIAEIAAGSIRRQRSLDHLEKAETTHVAPLLHGEPKSQRDLQSVSDKDRKATIAPADTAQPRDTLTQNETSDDSPEAMIEGELREMLIEVVRYKKPIGSVSTSDPLISTLQTKETMNSSHSASAENLASDATRQGGPSAAETKATGLKSKAGDAVHVVHRGPAREESLRFLIRHIHDTRDVRKEKEVEKST